MQCSQFQSQSQTLRYDGNKGGKARQGEAGDFESVKNLRRDGFGGYDDADVYTLDNECEVQVV